MDEHLKFPRRRALTVFEGLCVVRREFTMPGMDISVSGLRPESFGGLHRQRSSQLAILRNTSVMYNTAIRDYGLKRSVLLPRSSLKAEHLQGRVGAS